MVEQWQNARLGIEGLWVRALPEALHYGLRRPGGGGGGQVKNF